MISRYKGYEISVERNQTLSGDDMLFWSIFRDKDGFECASGSYSGSESVREFVKILKERIDNELLESDPWGEKAIEEEYINW